MHKVGNCFVDNASWSNWVELMVTTNFDLVLDLFSAAKCPKRPLFGPKCPF